ncbi:hypothetical protein BU26DRAFT_515239 [Trematosphaeria pertusa]|uniref:Uncharacterized protein n=1 Tax=Trematosphaeria pertusa TaxID=390896 RepID=A0A6A6IQR0_9PLEO|nr:uncharacterized protein BU26DRAFT_515239 [Trematosphaeria pertusa]KAF2252791.1 hypothetical protein BU26DRAFT_515239 [Trematosphaeria pertusa]
MPHAQATSAYFCPLVATPAWTLRRQRIARGWHIAKSPCRPLLLTKTLRINNSCCTPSYDPCELAHHLHQSNGLVPGRAAAHCSTLQPLAILVSSDLEANHQRHSLNAHPSAPRLLAQRNTMCLHCNYV